MRTQQLARKLGVKAEPRLAYTRGPPGLPRGEDALKPRDPGSPGGGRRRGGGRPPEGLLARRSLERPESEDGALTPGLSAAVRRTGSRRPPDLLAAGASVRGAVGDDHDPRGALLRGLGGVAEETALRHEVHRQGSRGAFWSPWAPWAPASPSPTPASPSRHGVVPVPSDGRPASVDRDSSPGRKAGCIARERRRGDVAAPAGFWGAAGKERPVRHRGRCRPRGPPFEAPGYPGTCTPSGARPGDPTVSEPRAWACLRGRASTHLGEGLVGALGEQRDGDDGDEARGDHEPGGN